MSQVIVTNDQLKPKREKSRAQEQRIDRESQFGRWRRSDITGPDPVAKLIGVAAMPILALWGLLVGLMGVIVAAVNFLFKGLGKLVGGKRDLITGE